MSTGRCVSTASVHSILTQLSKRGYLQDSQMGPRRGASGGAAHADGHDATGGFGARQSRLDRTLDIIGWCTLRDVAGMDGGGGGDASRKAVGGESMVTLPEFVVMFATLRILG